MEITSENAHNNLLYHFNGKKANENHIFLPALDRLWGR
jgi:hypothetical protein